MLEISNNLKKEIQNFSPISLEEMDNVKLMKRTDTKFVIHEKDLVSVLKSIEDEYRVVEIKSNRITTYSSLYFDTPEHKFYKDHHNGKNNRTKIRIRKYVESDICFLEIKQKDGKGNTTKTRTSIPDFEPNLLEKSLEFIQHTTQETFELKPIIWNQFNRVTLVNKTAKERLTIDVNLSFKKNGTLKTYDNLVIIELKQERFNRSSPIVQQLKSKQINPYSISKYCIGMIGIYNELKYNRFKEKLLKINKITA
ncbi:polyphosphate polymerase domain-containing protein [Yeosuana sp.]|uniref:polyphosphate polymerase domain-containing protein n=1 Tax=Yeosuana sp. TaxID=2529388 RepID=UPI0040550CE1